MFEIRGLDALKRQLDRLSKNAQALHGTHHIPITDLLSPAFMRSHTKVTSFEALIEAGGFKVESQADFEAIPDAEWEKVIRAHTSFSSWKQMLQKASEEYASKRLMQGI